MDVWERIEKKVELFEELIDKFGDLKGPFGIKLETLKETSPYPVIKDCLEHRRCDPYAAENDIDWLIRHTLNIVEGRMKEYVISDEAHLRGKECVIRVVCYYAPEEECEAYLYPIEDHSIGRPRDIGVKGDTPEEVIAKLSAQSYTQKCFFADPDFKEVYDLVSGDVINVEEEAEALIKHFKERFEELRRYKNFKFCLIKMLFMGKYVCTVRVDIVVDAKSLEQAEYKALDLIRKHDLEHVKISNPHVMWCHLYP